MSKTKKVQKTLEPSGRQDALQRVIAQIEKQYGQGAIMQMDEQHYARIEGIPTGSLSLDIALGGSGIPRGRATELFGPESSGKTTLALHVVASAQRAGGVAAFIDAEHALDTTWAKRLGVDVSSLLISQPDTGEQALDITEMLIRSNSVDVIVVDSVAALTPAAEIRGETVEEPTHRHQIVAVGFYPVQVQEIEVAKIDLGESLPGALQELVGEVEPRHGMAAF